MNSSIDISSDHLALVKSILNIHLPSHAKVWAFGSRTKAMSKQYSDLDLVINADTSLTLACLSKLSDAFEESTLPFKVDIIDWQTISHDFKKRIEKDRVVLR